MMNDKNCVIIFLKLHFFKILKRFVVNNHIGNLLFLFLGISEHANIRNQLIN